MKRSLVSPPRQPTTALVLLSGGVDSVAAMHYAKETYSEVACLSFWYGQPHSREVDVAYGYAPGEGGWWLDRSIAATPLRIFVLAPSMAHGFTMLGALPLVTVHRQIAMERTEVRGLYLEVAREERKDKLVEAFSENARALPRRLLLGEWERLGRAAPTPRVRRSPGPRLPLGGAS